jgi:TPR repeat protein
VDERLGFLENKAMKLLISTFFTLILLGFAGGSYGQDFEETKLLAEQGDLNAQLDLGTLYSRGLGIPENDAEGVEWFWRAAKQGSRFAFYELGVHYGNGRGVVFDSVKAYAYFSIAATLDTGGSGSAESARVLMVKRLSPEGLILGQNLATKCFESDYQDCE